MSKVDIELLNKHYNNPSRKAFNAFNIKMQNKKRKRLSRIDKKPLNEHEKFLYENDTEIDTSNITCNGFYKHNGKAHILLPLTKTKIESFYEESKEINRKCPIVGFIGTTIMDEQHKKSFLSITNPNRFGMSRVCEITPKDSCLSKYVKFILISAIGISYDSICVDFEVYYNGSFLEEFDKCLVDDFVTPIEYKKLFLNGRNTISYSRPFKERSRADYVEDVLFEIKSRVIDFISRNYSVFDLADNPIPFSIDEYRTNLDSEDRFLAFYDYIVLDKKMLLESFYRSSDQTQKGDLVFMDLKTINKHPFYELNRGRLLFFVEDDEMIDMDHSFSFVLMLFLQNHYLQKYAKVLNNKYSLFEKMGTGKYRILYHAYRDYTNLCLQASNCQTLLNYEKLNIFPYISDSKYLKARLEGVREETNVLNIRNDNLDAKINNIMSSKNNASSMKVALIALFVSIISVLVSIAAFILPFFLNNIE